MTAVRSGGRVITPTGVPDPGWVEVAAGRIAGVGGGGAKAFHLAHGTTTSLASLVTAPVEQLVNTCTALIDHFENGTFAGIYPEGPFLSPARCGAHDPQLLLAPTNQKLDRLLQACGNAPLIVTLAPELDGGLRAVSKVYRRCSRTSGSWSN